MQRRFWNRLACSVGLFSMAAIQATAAEAPTLPNNMFIRAEQTDQTYQIKVTWADMAGETRYDVLRSFNPAPGPMIVSAAGTPAIGQDWEMVGGLPQDATEFVHGTIFAGTYAICGTAENSEDEVTCFGPSNFEAPVVPEGNASTEDLRVFVRGIDELGFVWNPSENTLYTRVTLTQDGSVVDERELNRAFRSQQFFNLAPNTLHRFTVCVRSSQQSSSNETCQSLQASTLPQVPGGIASISVVEPVEPTSASVTFEYESTQDGPVSNIVVNLIRGNEILSSRAVFPDGPGLASYTVGFNSLSPFTDYEVWAVPLNRSGVGAAAGVSFVTPELVRILPEPLSGDSVMLLWSERAPGTYALEKLDGDTWNQLASFVSLRPGPRRVVLDEASSEKQVRLTWRLASLASTSAVIAPEPLTTGAPELISIRRSTAVTDAPQTGLARADQVRRLAARYTVTFRATRGGLSTYELERLTTQGWRLVQGATLTAAIPSNQVRSLVDTSQAPELATSPPSTAYRVCRAATRGERAQRACSAAGEFASLGIVRAE